MKWFHKPLFGGNTVETMRSPKERLDMQTPPKLFLKSSALGGGFKKYAYPWRRRNQNMETPPQAHKYHSKMRQDMDLDYILNQLCSIIRSGAPLSQGLDALMREERRSRENMHRGSFWRSSLAVFFAAIALGISLVVYPAVVLCCLIATTLYFTYRYRTAQKLYRKALIVFVLMLAATAMTAYALVLIDDARFLEEESGAVFQIKMALLYVLIAFVGGYGLIGGVRLASQDNPREVVLSKMRDGIEGGSDLSGVMREQPRLFPKSYTAIVQAGESSGQLAACLETLASDCRTGLAKKNQLVATMTHLGLTIIVHLAVFGFLLFYVAPTFLEVHESFEIKSPVPFSDSITAVFNAISTFMNKASTIFRGDAGHRSVSFPSLAGALLLLVLLAVAIGLLAVRCRRRGLSLRRGLCRILARIPLVGGLVVSHNLEFISYMLARLLSVGTPLDAALSKTIDGNLSAVYTHMLKRVQERTAMGETLTDAFLAESTASVLPPTFTGMAAIGERSGMLPQAFDFLASYYNAQNVYQETIIMQLIQPVGIVLLGFLTLGFALDLHTLLVGISDSIITEMY